MVVDSVKEFNTTYRPFLEACMRRMQFLSQQTKLRWCKSQRSATETSVAS